MQETLVFLDTEFTDLAESAELMSAGFVTLDGEQLYLERTDYDPCKVSEFVHEHVIPLMDASLDRKLPATGCCALIADWLSQFKKPILIIDSQWDIHVIHELFAIHGGICRQVPGVEFRMLHLSDYENEAWFEPAVDAYFEENKGMQHHALHDAMAMRAGWRSVNGFY